MFTTVRLCLVCNKIGFDLSCLFYIFIEETFNWKKFAWHTELEDYWSNYETNTTSTIFRGAHFSEVDAVIMTTVNI